METVENKYEHRHRCGGRKHRAGWILLGIVGFTAFAFLFGAVVMWLWNGLMPAVFHLGTITYWQAVGLSVLARLLFGSLHHGPSGRGRHSFGPWKHHHAAMNAGSCEGVRGSKWSHYDQYWNEEGENAFNEYLKRKGGAPAGE
jgi:hypothetical protein